MEIRKKKAILVDVISPDSSDEEAAKRMEELESLVNTYGSVVVVKTIQKRGLPDYKTYIGSGKVNEILAIGQELGAERVIVNNLLKPRQTYNLNEIFRAGEMKAWDRVDLILKIFSKHANSTEAKLQIELASIKHMGPRIFDMGIELSRQAGAMGVRAGQGESNTEMMKRHLRRQELNILKKLEHYDTIRKGHRRRRERQNYKTAALVGYTNAGKSSLLNALTGKGAYVANQLFATLDTRVGKLFIPNENPSENGEYNPGREILISDTIGFIQNLPPGLIQAFKSTLSETVAADILLHVIDVSDPYIDEKIEVVEEILTQLGLEDKPKCYIFNKLDLVPRITARDYRPYENEYEYKGLVKAGEGALESLGWHVEPQSEDEEPQPVIDTKLNLAKLEKKYAKFNPVFVSAHAGENLEDLINTLSKV